MNLRIKTKFLLTTEYWKRYAPKMGKCFFSLLGVAWTVIEMIDRFFGYKDLIGFWWLIGGSAVISFLLNTQKLKFDYLIRNRDIKIKVVIGDIFKQNGDVVITTNTTFDTAMDNGFISKKSLQGKFVEKYYSKIDHLDRDLDEGLENIVPKEILDRKNSKNERYEVGTTVKITHENFKSYWLALADVNDRGKPSCSFSGLQVALEGLWNFMLHNGHMDKLVIPIIGSGRSSINESRERILREIIYSFVSFSNEKKITEELVICIYPQDFIDKNIDLQEINNFLEYTCRYRYYNPQNTITSTGI